MKSTPIFLIGMVGAALLMADANTARADRKMVVLIDATGSMLTPRKDPTCVDPSDPSCPSDPTYPTRFDAAKGKADFAVEMAAGNSTPGNELNGVRIFIFHSLGATNGIVEVFPTDPGRDQPGSPGWYTATAARHAITALAPPDGSTPLAYSLCKAGDAFLGLNNPDTIRDLQTFTDGGENNSSSIPAPNCYFDDPDWQTAVLHHLLNVDGVPVTSSTTLFTNVASPMVVRSAATNPESAELALLGRSSVAPLLSDADFFRDLANATGGTFSIFADNQHVPVYADMNGDAVVSRDDAILLARKFGQPADANPQFDLNHDGVIGFDDYRIVVSKISQPDRYVTSGPISCNAASKQIVIDGQAIEDGGITIDALNSCRIIIRNSLVVSGRTAIAINGNAQVTVDHSIIVGEQAAIVLHGEANLSAANTIFHGATQIKGRLNYIDRGSNTWE